VVRVWRHQRVIADHRLCVVTPGQRAVRTPGGTVRSAEVLAVRAQVVDRAEAIARARDAGLG